MAEEVYLYVKTPLDDGDETKFFLQEIQGEEQISGLFHYRLRLRTSDNSIDFSEIVGESVTVTIEFYGDKKRYINGMVSRFTQAENDGNFTTYYAEIQPWLWQLTLTSDSKIFQNQTVPEIIDAVFSNMGFTEFKHSLTGSYNPREYCVQYQETAFDFVSRLMEDEGIFYFFEHTEDTHTLVLADDGGAFQPCPDLSVAHFRQVSAEWEAEDMIDACTLEQQVIPGKYAADDFSFETPDTDLLTTVDGKEGGSLRIYEYPGGFTKTDDGKTIADKRMEALELPQKSFRGEGFCRAFIAGFTFDLEGHDREDMNTAYVLRSLSITCTQERYTNTFEAFPADVPFRPPLATKKPRIFGTQTAVVVGKSGEEIWTDNYGRVKVQFHWDQEGKNDENSSCWVRVAQIWAGKGWGTFFVPRIGTEVIVSFLDGDPDVPIIIGTVYNANQIVPYTLPGEQNLSTIKTVSTKQGEAGNEIRFNDTKDAEELFIHAQKDMSITVENDEIISIKQNRTTEILEANDTLTVEKGDRTVQVNTGNESHKVSKDFTLEVDGNLTIDVKGDVTIKAGTSLTNQAGTDLTIKAGTSLTNEAGTDLTNKAGTSLTNEASLDLTNKAGTNLTNEASLDLKNKGLSLTNEAQLSLTNKGLSLTNEAQLSLTNKASATQTVDGGGFLNVKGGLVKIN